MKIATLKSTLIAASSIISLFFSITLLFSSCEKEKSTTKGDWVCTCRYRKVLKDTTVNYPYKNTEREQAEKACDKQEVYLQSVYGPTGTSCSFGF